MSLFSVGILLATSCDGSWRLRWLLVLILWLMLLLYLSLKCLIASVGIWSLLCLVFVSVRCLVAMLMSGRFSMLKSVSSVSLLLVYAPQCVLSQLVYVRLGGCVSGC